MTREEAIRELIAMKPHIEAGMSVMGEVAYDMAIEALKAQRTGRWIIFPPFVEETCMCSYCMTKFKKAYQGSDTCPSCGARMEV